MMEPVQYALYERAQARHERIVKRCIAAIIIMAVLLVLTNAVWLIAWTQYDYSSSTSSVVEQNAEDGGDVNYIGNDGDITNGLSESNSNENADTP